MFFPTHIFQFFCLSIDRRLSRRLLQVLWECLSDVVILNFVGEVLRFFHLYIVGALGRWVMSI